MKFTDQQGREWELWEHGPGYLLTRPGAVQWVSRNELDTMTPVGLQGLRREGKAWVRDA
jgi:hypothetical protein